MENAALIAALFALLASISWGFGDFLAAKAAKTVGATTAAYCTSILETIIYVPTYFLILRPDVQLSGVGVAFAAAGGCFVTLAFYVFCRALVVGPVSAAVPISASYPLFTTIAALLVFDVSLSGLQLLAIVIVVFGILAISGLFTLNKAERRLRRGPTIALLSAVIFGVGFALMAQGVDRIGWQTATLFQTIASLLFLTTFGRFLQGEERIFRNLRANVTNHFVVLQAIAGFAGIVTINIAFGHDVTSGAVVSAISACYPVLTIWLALKHFKEEVRFVPLLGAAASIIGLIVLSIG